MFRVCLAWSSRLEQSLKVASFVHPIKARHLSTAAFSIRTPVFARQQCIVIRKMATKKPFQRLPNTVVPRNYDVKLTPDIPKFTFAGEEVIDVDVNESTEAIVLNSAEITISSVEFHVDGSSAPIVGQPSFDAEAETVTLNFPEKLPTGPGRLSIVFAGELNDKMRGFYRTKYTSPDGEERYAAVTQFEATDARRALPCWDEPALKASFDVTLVVPHDRVALSNMPVKSDEPTSDNRRIVRYERTPIMSTYLLAFIVGEYDYVEGRDADGVLIRVYTPVGKAEQGRFALDVAVKTLPFYKDYFNIPYPLPKMDLIAIADFAAGAMENWGLVTYRETAVLVDPENSSAASKQWVALVVGHELAHQWFGNLVTMEWWTHLWLNEGFASWIEYLCVDECFPDYDIWTQFVTNDFIRALELDAMANSHPIEVPVGHPSDIDEIFDAISYSKGSSVIRMLHTYIGDEAFRKGMHNYLKQHSYKNTFTEDLWSALADASGKPVGKVMQGWTEQMGFPVLEVTSEQRGEDRVVHMSQRKFGTASGDQLWMVPVNACTSASPNAAAASTMLDSREGELVVKSTPSNQWVKLNPGAIGFYRVKYSEAMLSELMPAIRSLALGARDRLNLQDDLFALAQAGQAPTVDALRLIASYVDEPDYTVWSSVASNVEVLGTLLANSGVDAEFSAFVRKLFTPVLARLGWSPAADEGHLPALLRSLIVGQLGRHGHTETVQEAQKRFAGHCNGAAPLPANLRAAVYNTVLTHGDEAVYNDMVKLFDTADIQEERVRIMRSLGSIRSEELLKRTLEFAVSDKVRSQDTVFVIGSVAGRSRHGRDLAWAFLQENWDSMKERFSGMFLIARIIKSCCSDFVTEERAVEVEKFFSTRPCPSAKRTIQQAIENIRRNAKWLERDEEAVKAFLKEQEK